MNSEFNRLNTEKIKNAIATVRVYRAAVIECERCERDLLAASAAMEEAKRDAVAASKFLTPDQRLRVSSLLADEDEDKIDDENSVAPPGHFRLARDRREEEKSQR